MAERGRSSDNETPELVTAARNGNLPMVKQLLKLQHPLDARDKDGATALYWASCRGHEKISQILLDAGCDISTRVKWGATAILAAADNGHEACLVQLVRRGADVNSANDRGDTPLHAAAYRGYLTVLRLLAAAHANPFLKNCSSMTPLQEAVAQGKLECVKHLKEYMRATPGPIFLSSPTLPNDTSLAPSMTDSCQTWPYDAPGISRQLHKHNSFPLQKNDEMNALRGYPGHDNVQFGSPVLAREYNNKYYSIPQESRSCFETRSLSSDLNLLVDSDGDNLAINHNSGLNISIDSLLPVSAPVQTLQGRQLSYFKSREPPTSTSPSLPPSLPADIGQTAESISPKPSRNIDFSPHFSHQSREGLHKAPKDLQEQQSHVKASSQELFPAEDRLRQPRAGRPTKPAGVREVIPGVGDVSEFLEQLQIKVVELQEKLAKSETENAELKDQLHTTQKENTKLKIQNSILRSSDKYSILRTRGDSEEIAYSRHTSHFPDLHQPKILIAEIADSEGSFGSRCAVESSEYEDSTS